MLRGLEGRYAWRRDSNPRPPEPHPPTLGATRRDRTLATASQRPSPELFVASVSPILPVQKYINRTGHFAMPGAASKPGAVRKNYRDRLCVCVLLMIVWPALSSCRPDESNNIDGSSAPADQAQFVRLLSPRDDEGFGGQPLRIALLASGSIAAVDELSLDVYLFDARGSLGCGRRNIE